MSNKKILILTEAMMPFCSDWGSCQRVYFYSSKLISEGFDVHVICRNNSKNPAGTMEIKGIKVTSPEPAQREGKSGFKQKIIHFCKNNKVILFILKKIFRFIYSEPNIFRGKESKQWARNNEQFIKKYIYEENIDCVIISGPPFGLFYLAPRIKELGVKIILDYRDPWNLWYEKYSVSEKYEKQAVEAADLIIASTNNLSQALKKKYKKEYVYPVLNGYDSFTWDNREKHTTQKNSKLVISYVGYILVNRPPEFRDPTVFLDASCEFLENRKDVEMRFIGVGDDLSTIKDKYKRRIIFKNRVSVEEALQEVQNSDAVVVIHTADDSSGKYIVCGKLYDYLRSGKFILSVGNKAAGNNNLLDLYNCGVCCNNDRDSIRECLDLIYTKWKNDLLAVDVPKEIDWYSRESQNTEFLRLINDLMIQGGKRNG